MHMIFTLRHLLILFIFGMVSMNLRGQVSMTTTGSHTQNFNTLAATGTGIVFTDNSTFANWYSQRSGLGTTYEANTGTGTTGGLYSYGAVAAADRALGAIGSGNAAAGSFAHGVLLRNTSGTSITDIKVSYALEQWRNSAATSQSITFYYKKSTSPISALNPNSNSTWTPVAALTLTGPVTGGTAGALNGDLPANRVTATNILIPGLSLADNEYIMLKWEDPDHSGTDHGLAIDDVTVNWTVTPVISNNADLSTLVVNNSSYTATATLTPSFSPANTNYSTSVSNPTTPVYLSFTRGQANSFVDARINGGAYNSPLLAFPLTVGVNTIDVRVTAQDGITVKVYTINITRAVAATPILAVTSPPAAFGNVCTSTTGGPNSFTINGTDLDGTAISIAALPGFSYSETIGGVYSNTLSFVGGNNFTGKTIFVKFSPVAVQSYDGNILLSGGGASGSSAPVTGSGINTAPSVSTGSNTVSGTSAKLNGSISASGCSAVSSYGFEYSITSGFTNGTGIQVTASNLGSGSFSTTVSGLVANVTYYYKAFAANGAATAYGTQQSFTTSSIVPVVMTSEPLLRFTENFSDVTNWSNNFTSGVGANHFSSVAVNAAGSIPNGVKITTATSSFSSGVSGGVQKGTGNIQLLATGSTDNSSAVAIDFYMDFSGVNAGTLSFDWASVNNSTGNRNSSLRVYASTDGASFTELVAADVLNFTNNVPTTGTVNNIALPVSFSNSPTARLRFYYHNGSGGTTGSRPKISIDNLTVTAFPNTPCVTPAEPTNLVFGTIAETSIQAGFTASSPAANEYLVIMSTSSSLTSNPINGQVYTIGDNVGDGDVIAKGSAVNFIATGLTGATTYYFFVYPVNSVCTGGPLYSAVNILSGNTTTVAGLPACIAPANQATNFVAGTTGINSIQASFTAGSGNEWLVLQSTDATLAATPLNAQVYNAGDIIGNAKVIQRSSATSFTAAALAPNTTYYYYVISLNLQACVNGPVYNTVSPLSGSQTTLPLPVCATPTTQPANLALNASNSIIAGTFNAVAGRGYDYLVIRSTSSTLSATPADNTDYNTGANLGGGTVVANTGSTSFTANNLAASTTYYFFVFSMNRNCTGGTKYLITSPLTGNATTTNAPANNYYFGTLHSHSDYSDGNKDNPGYTPTDNYLFATGSRGMDFLGISEHNHFSSLNNPGNELAKYHSGIMEATVFNATHPNFLALYGMEWGVISNGGHVVVYGDGMDDLFGWESNVNGNVGPNYDVYVPKSTYLGTTGLFKTINDYVAKNTFATLAHPNSKDYDSLDILAYDPVADEAITGTAVESGPATSTNLIYSNPGSPMFYLWYYQKLLSKGYHLGPTIDHDNHNTTFGRTTNSRTAVIAPSLSKSAIIKSVRDMHVYATQDYDTKVDYTINTRIMGSIFEDRNAPSISVTISDATTSYANAVIRVMYGIPGSGVIPVQIDSVIGSSLNFVDNNLPNHATGYYYIDITNGTTRTVTAPVWYTRTCSASSEFTVASCNSYTWEGTTYTSSTTATKLFTTVGGCDSTVTLHLTINSGPVSATIQPTNGNRGCPGTGVTFSAIANDGGNGAITSYQWLLNGNAVNGATTNSFTALQSGNYSVQAFNLYNCSVVSGFEAAIVEDITPPVPDLSGLPVISGECSVMLVAPTATDNCTGKVTATTIDPVSYTQQGTYTVTWVYADGNRNTATQTQTVMVHDITAPALLGVPQNALGDCDNIPPATRVTATDNCDPSPVVSLVETSTQNANVNAAGHYNYTITRTWTTTDMSGNTSVSSQTITVSDTKVPVITTPGNISQKNDAGLCSAVVAFSATASDICAPVTISYSHAPGSSFPAGNTLVTVTAVDVTGNTSAAVFTVTVTDTEKPTITAPGMWSVPNDAGTCSATILDLGNPVTSDNCGVESVSNDHPSRYFPVGTTIVTWSVTDIHGNITDTAKQTVTVLDNELPTISILNESVNNSAGICGATVVLGIPTTADNCGVASVSNNHPSSFFPVGVTYVTWTVTDNNGLTNTVVQTVTVTDNTPPVITAAPNQVFCTSAAGNYAIPVLTATDNCGNVTIAYTIAGATTRNGGSNNASGVFNTGVSTITWIVTDANGNTGNSTTTVTIHSIPVVTITVSTADNFCKNITLTASTAGGTATYNWVSGSSSFATTPQVSLGQGNGDGIYNVYLTVNGCTSTAASYNFQKQNLVNSYTILAFDAIELGENNTVATGSVGVTSAWGEAAFRKNSSVSSPGSFVKARYIHKNGSNINIANPVYSAATGITLPTMLFNMASTNNLPNKDVPQNSNTTVTGNYKNLTLKKGSNTVLTGSIFGTLKVEQGAQIRFTATTINIDKLKVDKGPRNGYSYIRFAPDTKVLVSGSVSISSQVYVNPDNNKLTFYLGDKKSGEEKFSVKGGDTKVTANIYLSNGKLKVTGGYSYGNGQGEGDRDEDDDRNYGQGNSYVYMTGLFIAEEVEGNGKNVIWNSFDCGAAPVQATHSSTSITQITSEEKGISEEELKVTVMPNPSNTFFTLKLESRNQTPVSMRVMDAAGRVVDARSKIGSNSTIQVGQQYSNGTYFAEMTQGSRRKVIQLVKGKG